MILDDRRTRTTVSEKLADLPLVLDRLVAVAGKGACCSIEWTSIRYVVNCS
jgi:hypothetical protein